MLNRYVFYENVIYLYEHLADFDNQQYYEFLMNNKMGDNKEEAYSGSFPSLYKRALSANKGIDLATQMELVFDNYEKFKQYLKENNLYDEVQSKLYLIDAVFVDVNNELISMNNENNPTKKISG